MKIKNVFIFPNGMVAVTDEKGEQVPHLQGSIFEVLGKIGNVADSETIFQVHEGKLNVAWYFEQKREEVK